MRSSATRRQHRSVDELDRVTRVEYTPEGWVAASTDPAGDRTAYGYDPMGRVTSVTDPNGNTTSYAYDPVGNLTGQRRPQDIVQTPLKSGEPH
ncbi:MAG: RHS repeat protein [Actinobacteria bacterium]|nr:RHS repeat protein [Actinomycetota bacterium]